MVGLEAQLRIMGGGKGKKEAAEEVEDEKRHCPVSLVTGGDSHTAELVMNAGEGR